MLRQFQTGRTSYRLERRGGSWWVVESWWEMGDRGEEDWSTDHGPFDDEQSAQSALAAMES